MTEVNKGEAIREAFTTLGGDAMPMDVVDYLQKKGIEVSTGYVSTEKSKIKKASESALMKSPVATSPTTEEAARSSPKRNTQNIVDLILTIKQLILDVGSKDELKRLIDAL